MAKLNQELLKKVRITTVFNTDETKWISTRYKYDNKIVLPVLLALREEKKDVYAFIEFNKGFEFVDIVIDYNWELENIVTQPNDVSNSFFDHFDSSIGSIDPLMIMGEYLIFRSGGYKILRAVLKTDYTSNQIYNNLKDIPNLDEVQQKIIQSIKYDINDSSFDIHNLTSLLNQYTDLKSVSSKFLL